jgi:hypothetical protein
MVQIAIVTAVIREEVALCAHIWRSPDGFVGFLAKVRAKNLQPPDAIASALPFQAWT